MATCKRLTIETFDESWGFQRTIVFADGDITDLRYPCEDTAMTLADVVRLINAANGYDDAGA